MSIKVVTGKVRFSYANVFEPKAVGDGAPKYSASILIPKKDKATLKKIEKAIQKAAEEGKSKHFGGKVPKNLRSPLRDGDVDREEDPAYEGMMFINANNLSKPGIVDEDLNKIIDPDEFYSGCYGRASLVFFAYNFEGTSKGVGVQLVGAQKTEDGERLAGFTFDAEADFGDDGDDDDDLLG